MKFIFLAVSEMQSIIVCDAHRGQARGWFQGMPEAAVATAAQQGTEEV